MEWAAAVVVLENANPATEDALNKLFRMSKSAGLSFNAELFFRIEQIADMAKSVEVSFAFLFQIDFCYLLSYQKELDNY